MMQRRLQILLFLVSILCGKLAINFGPASMMGTKCGDCETGYLLVAQNVVSGSGWQGNSGRFYLDRGPLHTLALSAAIYLADALGLEHLLIFQSLNLMLFGSTTVLIYLSILIVWGSTRITSLAPLLWVFCPYAIWALPQPFSANTLVFLITLTSFLWLRSTISQSSQVNGNRSLFFSGVAAGATILVSPIALMMPVVFWVSGAWAFGKVWVLQRAQGIFWMILGVFLVVAPWSSVAYVKTGEIVLSTNDVLLRNSLVNGFTFAVRGADYRRSLNLPDGVMNLMRKIDSDLQVNSSAGDSRQVAGVLVNNFVEDPTAFLELIAVKVLRAWYGTDSHNNEGLTTLISSIYLGLAVVAALIVLRRKNQREKFLVFFWLMISAYLWCVCIFVEPLVRYMVPSFALSVIVSAGLLKRFEKSLMPYKREKIVSEAEG